MIEIDIFGASYGEATVISYDAKDGRRFGVIDCHPSANEPANNPVVRFLREKGAGELSFIIATHPHDDHIRGLWQIVESFAKGDEKGINFLGWWGGFSLEYQLFFFEELERQCRKRGEVTSTNSRMLMKFLDSVNEHQMTLHETTNGIPDPFYEENCRHNLSLRLTPLSPWFSEKSKFIKTVCTGINASGAIDEVKNAPNRVSLALLLEYGNARIIFGGDAEMPNWIELYGSAVANKLRQVNFVKVPHHGSSTGFHNDMWYGMKSCLSKSPKQTIAVATKFTLGTVDLPETSALEALSRAGCKVIVVGGNSGNYTTPTLQVCKKLDIRTDVLSHFKAEIDADGTVRVFPGPCDLVFN